MSSQTGGSGGSTGGGGAQTLTKKEVLDALKKEGITDLDNLADFAVKKHAAAGGGAGAKARGTIIGPHWFVTA